MDGYLEDKRLKISFRNHFGAVYSVLLRAVGFMFLLIWFQFDKVALIVFPIMVLIDALPALYLHLTYFQQNKGEEYEIRRKEVIRYKNGAKEIYKAEEIEYIKIYLSPALYKHSDLHILSIEAYHHARVVLKSGEELLLTCLLAPKVEKALQPLEGVKIERKKRVFSPLV